METRVALHSGHSFRIEAPYPAVVAALKERGARGLARIQTSKGIVSVSVATVAHIQAGRERWEPPSP